ncbi:alpha/beta hydrolase [Paenibacillus taichungensis]|uniref:alpha/beta hydrolase n=1 Tax=Paenibacillus taichungensis TaxID=484184 RepID=UPI0039A46DF3
MSKWVQESVNGWTLHLLLPPSYTEGNRHYPVVYIQDGGAVAKACSNLLDHFFRSGKLPELILVGIEPHNRNDDYTPWPVPALHASFSAFGGQGSIYLKAITEQLKPYVDSSFRTLADSENTGILGCSLGGLISLFAAMEFPHIFGKVGALSASMWYEGFLDYMSDYSWAERHGLKLYMYVGSLEGVYKANAQAQMLENTRSACRMILAQGYPAERLNYVEEEGGTHDLLFFAKHLPEALSWLYQ